jgi:hypothetical protein
MKFIAIAMLTSVLALPQLAALNALIELEVSKPQLKAKHERMRAILEQILAAEKADIEALKAGGATIPKLKRDKGDKTGASTQLTPSANNANAIVPKSGNGNGNAAATYSNAKGNNAPVAELQQ